MATYLLTWEMGGGLGHIVNLLPIARNLAARGHRVVTCTRKPLLAQEIIGGTGIDHLPAPKTVGCLNQGEPQPRTFPQILRHCGFHSVDTLRPAVADWCRLLDRIEPDVAVLDYSPIALVACRARFVKQATVGTGFFTPPDETPMRDLRPWLPANDTDLSGDEDRVLAVVNQVLMAIGGNPLERLALLFHEVDNRLLLTFSELDHYGIRSQASYYGAWPNVSGATAQWSHKHGPRIFAYLKPFPVVEQFLECLKRLNCPVLVYTAGINPHIVAKVRSSSLFVLDKPVDLEEVGRTCDLAILNGNHGTTVSALLAGKPTLQIPLSLEQALFSVRIKEIYAGLIANPTDVRHCHAQLCKILEDERYLAGAMRFSKKYAGFRPFQAINAVIDRLEYLASSSLGLHATL